MTKANEYQVGGDHYSQAGQFQHWDWVAEYDIDYFVGVISKYITRWRKKGQPVQDLEKAVHYTVKLKELATDTPRGPNAPPLEGRRNTAKPITEADVRKFCSANRLTNADDFNALHGIFTWKDQRDLDNVIATLNALLEQSPPRRIQREYARKPSTEMEHPFGYDADAERKTE